MKTPLANKDPSADAIKTTAIRSIKMATVALPMREGIFEESCSEGSRPTLATGGVAGVVVSRFDIFHLLHYRNNAIHAVRSRVRPSEHLLQPRESAEVQNTPQCTVFHGPPIARVVVEASDVAGMHRARRPVTHCFQG